jgi:hypothetical protein
LCTYSSIVESVSSEEERFNLMLYFNGQRGESIKGVKGKLRESKGVKAGDTK